ncbi:hypothetical protein [Flammeovirga sp. SubArs3]|uniref:hypothetical protein n=1 Tax=Flammeovirga sp. SubArs3 TaxID=2995316 RepID=UPI00248CA292|nr:hypothetical protein [Flammeovirga sp. SubArs3]
MNNNVKQSAIELCKQLKNLLTQISEEQFIAPLDLFSGSSIGQHTRHIIEFYQCLIDSVKKGEQICYEDRQRSLTLESDKYNALAKIDEQISSFSQLDNYSEDVVLKVKDYAQNLEMNEWSSPSTISREMHYCNEHTVHHLAIIKVGLMHYFPGLNLNDSFGVAKSTYAYRKGK